MTIKPSGYEPIKNGLYETEAYGTLALTRRLSVRGRRIWEPMAGNHKMADVLKAEGAEVITSDIEVYDRPHDFIGDFYDDAIALPADCDGIISNPDYGPQNRLAAKFCARALTLTDGLVAALLPATFDFGSTRTALFRDNPRFLGKIALLDRIIWFPDPDNPNKTGTSDHAWYIWGPTANAPYRPIMRWASREDVAE